jgi:low affinity Fe/Cu permease
MTSAARPVTAPDARPEPRRDAVAEGAGASTRRSESNGNIYMRLAKAVARFCGRPSVFACAVGTIVVWAISGPLFGFSDTWQLWINTSTTIITFLMVFLIQNTQNRDTEAIQVKLDELIRATRGARNELMDMEELSEDELTTLRHKFIELAEMERSRRQRGAGDQEALTG